MVDDLAVVKPTLFGDNAAGGAFRRSGRSGRVPKIAEPKQIRPTVGALERSPSHLLHRALQLALDVYIAEAGPDALTQRQFAVLAAVEAHTAPTQTDLVRATGIDRSTLADMIARMTLKGVLVRQRSELEAPAIVGPLPAGAGAPRAHAQRGGGAADLRILSALGAAKRDAFVAALRVLARAGESTLLGEEAEKDQLETKPGKSKSKGDKAKRDDKPGKKARRKLKKAKRQGLPPAETPEPIA